MSIQDKRPMTEILDAYTLQMLDAYEAELDCRDELDGIDADEMLDTEA